MPIRPIPSTLTPGPRFTVACMGDSLTKNFGYAVRLDLFWPTLLDASLRALGARVRVRNFGRSGNTSTQMIIRFAEMTTYDVPTLGIIWAGANDPANSIVGATTQANIQAMAETLFTAGTTYVVIVNTQYLNYSSGGDTTSAQTSTYATLKGFQSAAATALIEAHPDKVAYCNLYEFMRLKIVNGPETQGSFSWHVADSNQHLNALGNGYVRDAVLATIVAQDGWLDTLKAG